jgi:hypothetical protein
MGEGMESACKNGLCAIIIECSGGSIVSPSYIHTGSPLFAYILNSVTLVNLFFLE